MFTYSLNKVNKENVSPLVEGLSTRHVGVSWMAKRNLRNDVRGDDMAFILSKVGHSLLSKEENAWLREKGCGIGLTILQTSNTR